MKLDVLVVGAHPDDAEISVGGTILRLVEAGRLVGVVDVTRGEMGTRGDRATRDAETEAATELLGLALRENLDLPDGRVEATTDARERLAALLRKYRPNTILSHHTDDLHPDHVATGELARGAWYLAGLRRLAEQAGEEAWRPASLFHFMSHVQAAPSLVVDVESVWEHTQRVVSCYASQLQPHDERDDGSHLLFGADILQRMETKARFWGEAIGARHGEPLLHRGPLRTDDPLIAALG